ncbi:MAG: DUF3850 domain-containing protein [Candidatus Woesearchaeota archaeon]
MIIEKKSWPESFQAIKEKRKTFDLRLNDFKCKPGDIMVFREWDPKKKKYTGRTVKKKVSYVLKTKQMRYWTKKDVDKHGFQVIALK